ncbi:MULTISPECIES: hypothetical protein [unclassified Arthrobacter]|nr:MULTISPECIES: hypothetical protein [unclassified Arthrobacter]
MSGRHKGIAVGARPASRKYLMTGLVAAVAVAVAWTLLAVLH